MFARLLYLTFALALPMILGLASLPVAAQSNGQGGRVVALVVTVGDDGKRADAIQSELQAIGVETLRSTDPNNAELRSILTRFAREAANSRATFVYLDAPVVTFQGRAFVLPAGTVLDRGTDLFTRALPLQAFSRSAAQAAQGGATVATLTTTGVTLPKGVIPATESPAQDPASSPVLTAPVTAFPGVLEALSSAVKKNEEVEISTVLRRMSVQDGASISGFPSRPIFLKEPAKAAAPEAASQPAPVAAPVALPPAEEPAAAAQEAAEADVPASAPAETLEELSLLEQSLSRAAKRAVQTRLRDLDFYKGLVDGIFGPQTRAAIKAFQDSRTEEQTGILTRRQLIDLSA
ncbi:peptidoglycan-binding domain-containing protein [Roseibium litorale]|uniref:Peptidoglycan-binding protein n=1 Tax=Roseibium litorale TaxID=2803841 RepID=A0ABR9CKN1_9HYPH|nr:peptidoglycan-binding domain-containing protein [Roseibium litorale]MBD8891303.1 peptidoglycan-binding protein [Roseibium litorale]